MVQSGCDDHISVDEQLSERDLRTFLPQRKGVMAVPTLESWFMPMISVFVKMVSDSLVIFDS